MRPLTLGFIALLIALLGAADARAERLNKEGDDPCKQFKMVIVSPPKEIDFKIIIIPVSKDLDKAMVINPCQQPEENVSTSPILVRRKNPNQFFNPPLVIQPKEANQSFKPPPFEIRNKYSPKDGAPRP